MGRFLSWISRKWSVFARMNATRPQSKKLKGD
jgi:hypothetical protein